jgi:hypothetical protein
VGYRETKGYVTTRGYLFEMPQVVGSLLCCDIRIVGMSNILYEVLRIHDVTVANLRLKTPRSSGYFS